MLFQALSPLGKFNHSVSDSDLMHASSFSCHMFESITFKSLTKLMFIISNCFQAREERGRIQVSFLGLE